MDDEETRSHTREAESTQPSAAAQGVQCHHGMGLGYVARTGIV